MQIGYARVSTFEQSANMQTDALELAGCEKIFTDKVSGIIAARPGLSKLKEILRKGDTLVVWRLDRLGRSLKDLIEWANYLEKEGVALKSLQESIDTSTTTGKLIFHFFGAMAEFERNLISERTLAGLAAARARGRKGGRPKLESKQVKVALKLYHSKIHTVEEVCKLAGIARPTLYRYLKEEEQKKAV